MIPKIDREKFLKELDRLVAHHESAEKIYKSHRDYGDAAWSHGAFCATFAIRAAIKEGTFDEEVEL